MKKYLPYAIVMFLSTQTANAQFETIPRVKSILPSASANVFKVDERTAILYNEKDSSELRDVAITLQEDLKSITGLEAPIVFKKSTETNYIDLKIVQRDQSVTSNESYQMNIQHNVEIRASTPNGIYYGIQTMLQSLKIEQVLGFSGISDSPDFQVRSVMLDCGRKYYSVEFIKKLIRRMSWFKMNTLHLHFTEWNGFRLNSPKYPGLASKESYNRSDIEEIEKYAAKHFVTIVPEIDLPAHATHITNYKPNLAFKCPSMRHAKWQGEAANNADQAWALDVTRPEVREWINDLIDEFIPWFKGPYFHIGGDEYQYDPEKWKCPELVKAMKKRDLGKPGDVFIEWLNEINRRIKSHGKQTQIWNWWRFHKNSTSIQPDKDIIVNVWNKPRLKEILEDGYKVIVTPEADLYVSPGLENAEGYGIVDCKQVYEDWSPDKNPNILGYKLCIWSDRAEHHTDNWFEGKAYEPRVVTAEQFWGASKKKNLNELFRRADKVGDPPFQP